MTNIRIYSGLLCRREDGEKKKKKARGARWEEEREQTDPPAFSLFPSSPVRFLFFHYCYLYWDTRREPLREERVPPRRLKTNKNSGEMHKPIPTEQRVKDERGKKKKKQRNGKPAGRCEGSAEGTSYQQFFSNLYFLKNNCRQVRIVRTNYSALYITIIHRSGGG